MPGGGLGVEWRLAGVVEQLEKAVVSRSRGTAKVVLRRRFDSIFGLLASVGAIIATTYALLTPFPDTRFADQLEFILVTAPLSWFMWMVSAHPVALPPADSGELIAKRLLELQAMV